MQNHITYSSDRQQQIKCGCGTELVQKKNPFSGWDQPWNYITELFQWFMHVTASENNLPGTLLGIFDRHNKVLLFPNHLLFVHLTYNNYGIELESHRCNKLPFGLFALKSSNNAYSKWHFHTWQSLDYSTQYFGKFHFELSVYFPKMILRNKYAWPCFFFFLARSICAQMN